MCWAEQFVHYLWYSSCHCADTLIEMEIEDWSVPNGSSSISLVENGECCRSHTNSIDCEHPALNLEERQKSPLCNWHKNSCQLQLYEEIGGGRLLKIVSGDWNTEVECESWLSWWSATLAMKAQPRPDQEWDEFCLSSAALLYEGNPYYFYFMNDFFDNCITVEYLSKSNCQLQLPLWSWVTCKEDVTSRCSVRMMQSGQTTSPLWIIIERMQHILDRYLHNKSFSLWTKQMRCTTGNLLSKGKEKDSEGDAIRNNSWVLKSNDTSHGHWTCTKKKAKIQMNLQTHSHI